MTNTDTTILELRFASLNFKLLKERENEYNNAKVLREVFGFLRDEKTKGKGVLVDRYEKRDDTGKREIFVNSIRFLPERNRIVGSIALLRSDKRPKIKKEGEFELLPIEDFGQIAEETFFFIDYRPIFPIVCIEFNSNGPRTSDLEYYIRQIAHKHLRLVKAVELTYIMDNTLDKTLTNIHDVLNIEVKIPPKSISYIDKVLAGKYFTQMNSLGSLLRPRFLKFEMMYQVQGKSYDMSKIKTTNKNAITMVKDVLNTFKRNRQNEEYFDTFEVVYVDKAGNEEVYNLMKDKKKIEPSVDLALIKKPMDLYEIIEDDLNDFIDTRA